MLIEDAIYQILKANAAVTARVAGRFFSGVAPQTVHATPYIVYRADGHEIVGTLEGGCELVRTRIEIFSAATTAGDAALTDAAVIKALHEFRGTVVKEDTSPEESIVVQGIYATPNCHEHGYVDKTKLHEFFSEFDCHYTDPSRITESEP